MLSSLRTAAHRLPPRARACALLHSRAALDAYSSPPTVLSTAFLSTTHSISPLSPPAHSRPLHTTAARHPKAALHPKALPVLPDRQFAKSVFAENPAAKWLHESGIYKNSGTTPAKPIPRKTERTRVHVVNEKFVDQIIDYLGPSLDRHKDCDLIDINPGVGIWSRALNKALKPRKHILMEPDEEYYRPQLESLLAEPNVELVRKHGILWTDFDSVLQSLPHQKTVPKTGPIERNDTLLITMSLATSPKRKYHSYESLAGLVLHQMMTSVRVRSIAQRYGLVRLLLWVNDEDKRAFLPKSIYSRRRAALDCEVAMEWLHEVAGEDDLSKERRDDLIYRRQPTRERTIQTLSTRRTLERMQRDGRVCPPDRESEFVKEVRAITPEMDAQDKKLVERIIAEVRERQRFMAEQKAAQPDDQTNEFNYDSTDPANYFLRKDLTTFRSQFFMRLPDNETGEVSKRKKLYGVALWRARQPLPGEKATENDEDDEDDEGENEDHEDEDEDMDMEDMEQDMEDMDEAPKKRRSRKTKAKVDEAEEAPEKAEEVEKAEEDVEEKPKKRRRRRNGAEPEPAEEKQEEDKPPKRKRRTKAEMEAARIAKAEADAAKAAAKAQRAAARSAHDPIDDDDIRDFNDEYYDGTTASRVPWAAPDCDRIKPNNTRRNAGSLTAATKRALGSGDKRTGSVREVRDLLARAFVHEWRRLRTEYQQGRLTLDEYMREHCILNDDIRVSHVNYIASTRMQSDDEHGAVQDPPILLWDRRQYEPMVVRQGDFYPDVPCALLDLQPKSMHPLLRDNVDHASVVFDVLAMSLVNTSTDVESMLNRVWPGAADGCLPNMPKTTDLGQHGTPMEISGHAITAMTGRRMNEEQYMELLEAWYKWPFRPSFKDLICHHTEEPTSDVMVEGGVLGVKHVDMTTV